MMGSGSAPMATAGRGHQQHPAGGATGSEKLSRQQKPKPKKVHEPFFKRLVPLVLCRPYIINVRYPFHTIRHVLG